MAKPKPNILVIWEMISATRSELLHARVTRLPYARAAFRIVEWLIADGTRFFSLFAAQPLLCTLRLLKVRSGRNFGGPTVIRPLRSGKTARQVVDKRKH